MRIRSFIIAYALVLAILLFADRRPGSAPQDRYSHVIDLTVGDLTVDDLTLHDLTDGHATAPRALPTESSTRIIAPGTLIPGTWTAGQIPSERLVAPLVVLDLDSGSSPKENSPISLDDIAAWESRHGMIPQGAVVAIRRLGAPEHRSDHRSRNVKNDAKTNAPSIDDWSTTVVSTTPFPIARDAAMFLIEARYTIGFAIETPVNLTADRTLARQLALHGAYVVEGTARFTSLPATGSLIIVAPVKTSIGKTTIAKTTIEKPDEARVRILAMVR